MIIVLLALPNRCFALNGRRRRHLGPRTRIDILRTRFGRTRASKVSFHIPRTRQTRNDVLTTTRYAPGPSFRAMELLLGRISSLGDVGDFTTQRTTITDIDTEDLRA